jgi:hypothetical protein
MRLTSHVNFPRKLRRMRIKDIVKENVGAKEDETGTSTQIERLRKKEK